MQRFATALIALAALACATPTLAAEPEYVAIENENRRGETRG